MAQVRQRRLGRLGRVLREPVGVKAVEEVVPGELEIVGDLFVAPSQHVAQLDQLVVREAAQRLPQRDTTLQVGAKPTV